MSRDARYRRATLMQRGTGRRPGKRGYWVEWSLPAADGRPRRRRICLPSRELARRFADNKTHELNAPLFGEIAWPAMLAQFADAIAGLAEQTQAAYLGALERFVAAVGRPPAARDLTPRLLQRYVAAQLAKKRSPATLHKEVRHLRVFLRYGLRQEPPWFARDPSAALRLPRIPQRLIRAPSADDVAGLLAAAQRRPDDPLAWWLLIRLGFETGLRLRDLLALTWEAVRIETIAAPGRPAAARTLIHATAMKTSKEGLWCVTAAAEAALERRREQRPAAQRLFDWSEALPRTAWRELVSSAGQTWRFHDLRRAAATICGSSAIAATAADLLQHHSPSVTRGHYLDALVLAAERADRLEGLRLPGFDPSASPRRPASRTADPLPAD